jgi:hypothetical protein
MCVPTSLHHPDSLGLGISAEPRLSAHDRLRNLGPMKEVYAVRRTAVGGDGKPRIEQMLSVRVGRAR